MKYQGVILKLTKNKAIVTTDDFQCSYIKRKPTLYVGKEVEFSDEEIIRNGPVLLKSVLSVACALFVIIWFLNFTGIINSNNLPHNPRVFAYIGVDINPSLEIEIDDTGKVLDLIPLNDDASVLAKKIEIKGISISEAIDDIIVEVKKESAISETQKHYVLISNTLSSKKDEYNKEFQSEKEKLDTIINSLKDDIQKSGKADAYIVQANIEEREVAQKEGISTGRYVLYNEYKDIESGFSIDEAKEASVNELIKVILDNESEKGNLEETPMQIPTPTPTPGSALTPALTPASTPASTPALTPTSTPASTPALTPTSTPALTPASTPTPTPIPTPTSMPEPAQTARVVDSPFVRFESSNYRTQFIRHQSFGTRISQNVEPVEDSIFKIVPGLADPNCISLESVNYPGHYLRHENFKIILSKYEDRDLFREDATFKIVPGLADENMISFQSFNHPYRYIRHREYDLYAEEIVTDLEKKDATYIRIEVPWSE